MSSWCPKGVNHTVWCIYASWTSHAIWTPTSRRRIVVECSFSIGGHGICMLELCCGLIWRQPQSLNCNRPLARSTESCQLIQSKNTTTLQASWRQRSTQNEQSSKLGRSAPSVSIYVVLCSHLQGAQSCGTDSNVCRNCEAYWEKVEGAEWVPEAAFCDSSSFQKGCSCIKTSWRSISIRHMTVTPYKVRCP